MYKFRTLTGRLGLITQRLRTKQQLPVVATSITRHYASPLNSEPFLNGSSTTYLEELELKYQQDPHSVGQSWKTFFDNIYGGAMPGSAYPTDNISLQTIPQRASGGGLTDKDVDDHLNVQKLIRAFQIRGHNIANLDPLGLNAADLDDTVPPELSLLNYKMEKYVIQDYKIGEEDMKRKFRLPTTTRIGGNNEKILTLREIINRLMNVYCKDIGVEYMHINDLEMCDWLRQKFETPGAISFTAMDKKLILERLIRATMFEEFLAKKWTSEKRFGLEGCEVLVPAMKCIIDHCSKFGVESIHIGMPHRGRLNVLANVCRKPLEQILAQFDPQLEATEEGSGDVKYHLGMFQERYNYFSKKNVRISLVANPSHLEAVDPVVQGKTRAEQFYLGDSQGKKVMSMLLHGDAAFAGQGVVYETFHLSDLPDYTTHGTIHIVVNNQIGFTTDPHRARSSPYCTDVAKVVGAPIFHVNGDKPEAVMYVCKVAAEYRDRYSKDVVIDLVCYRRHGHNEIDEPMFTQPEMYKKIRKHKSVLELYSQEKIKESVMTQQEYEEQQAGYQSICEEAYAKGNENIKMQIRDWLDSPWKQFFKNDDAYPLSYQPTGTKEETIQFVGNKFSEIPTDIVIHGGLKRIMKQRQEMMSKREVDWALAEAMAFGSLLLEGVHVRLSGQDVERGTFSHRHHVLHDQNSDVPVLKRPLCELDKNQAKYDVCNSSLSEFAALGFEHGFNMFNPKSLVCWEAQFGDFANNAQCIIDQFISSGQAKWYRQSGLVLLLPHGYEGMGPEHSSARLERYLQMSNDDPDQLPESGEEFVVKQLVDSNWIIANCSSPANYYHALRRQVVGIPFRKPLIIMTPKSLLRHPEARSSFDEMTEGTFFKRVIPETGKASENPEGVRGIVFCSGKVYYDLRKERDLKGLDTQFAISRIEQLAPFPYDLVEAECQKYPNAQLIWAQEEHKNMGAWAFIQPRADSSNGHQRDRIRYAGRPASAATATGNKQTHKKETQDLLDQTFAQ